MVDTHLKVRDEGLLRAGYVGDRRLERNNRHKNLVRQAVAGNCSGPRGFRRMRR
jgi:hypothetical protein